MPNRRFIACCLGLLLSLFGAAQAQAQVQAVPSPETSTLIEPKAAAPFGVRRPVSAAALAAQRGGTEVADMPTLSGTVSGNQASNTVSGSNSITGGAFSNSSGLPVVVQNSGNNVLIQTSTVVNVTIK